MVRVICFAVMGIICVGNAYMVEGNFLLVAFFLGCAIYCFFKIGD